MAVIECKNVNIIYKTGNFRGIGFKEYVIKRATGKYESNVFLADENINFSLKKGDMLGIIGTNGAGKSTLLKAITGIMQPASGTIKAKGDIAAFLELATGFDPEMTIKENTFLRGAMLGYTRDFMKERYDSIIEFAELQGFEDYTFKQLSSGMRSRLAFAIAAQVDPDILILDEVLSVGDGAFRKKSGNKMKEILSAGVTGLIVSHSISQIKELCNCILWLDHGKQIAFSDDVELYCNAYEEFLNTHVLPENMDDIHRLADATRVKMSALEQEQNRKRIEELSRLTGEDAVKTAIKILSENRPEALSSDYEEI